MVRVLILVILGVLAAGSVRADPLSIDLAADHIDITTGFTGASIDVFGVKHGQGHVVMTLQGPAKDVVVRRKDNVLGAWLNRSWLRFKDVPLYYNFGMEEGRDPQDMNFPLGAQRLVFEPKVRKYKEDVQKQFLEALIAQNVEQRLYSLTPQPVHYIDNGFFKAGFYVPANVPAGMYRLQAHLVRAGNIVFTEEKTINVGQVGFSADIYFFAKERALLYAMVCVFMAFLAGWVSNKIVRRN